MCQELYFLGELIKFVFPDELDVLVDSLNNFLFVEDLGLGFHFSINQYLLLLVGLNIFQILNYNSRFT